MSAVFWADAVLSIADIPYALQEYPQATCAVIDVIRATTTISVLEERGAETIQIASSIEEALEIWQTHQEYFLVGEKQGICPEGFQFGNSPAEIAHTDFTNKHVVIATTNGTKAITACFMHHAGVVTAACLRNAAAAAQCILANFPAPGLVVCAGRGMLPAADDTFTAGIILAELQRLANLADITITFGEAAQLAISYAENCHNDTLQFLRNTMAGKAVHRVQLDDDLNYCTQRNTRAELPIILLDETGRLLAPRSHVSTAHQLDGDT